ncbi:hypothetical protein HK096_001845 [Nowakowskiella sp. JEL0078]|nr:hypothetical protein HK096_001845 [Nowakowskiella sp. JEL0078]
MLNYNFGSQRSSSSSSDYQNRFPEGNVSQSEIQNLANIPRPEGLSDEQFADYQRLVLHHYIQQNRSQQQQSHQLQRQELIRQLLAQQQLEELDYENRLSGEFQRTSFVDNYRNRAAPVQAQRDSSRSSAVGFLQQRGQIRSGEQPSLAQYNEQELYDQQQLLLQRKLLNEQLAQQQQLIYLLQQNQQQRNSHHLQEQARYQEQLHLSQIQTQLQYRNNYPLSPLSPSFNYTPEILHISSPTLQSPQALPPVSPAAREIRRNALNEVAAATVARRALDVTDPISTNNFQPEEDDGIYKSPITQLNIKTGWHVPDSVKPSQDRTSQSNSGTKNSILSILDNDDNAEGKNERNSGLETLIRAPVFIPESENVIPSAEAVQARKLAVNFLASSRTAKPELSFEEEPRKEAINFLVSKRLRDVNTDINSRPNLSDELAILTQEPENIAAPIALKSPPLGKLGTGSNSESDSTDSSRSRLIRQSTPPGELITPPQRLSSASPTPKGLLFINGSHQFVRPLSAEMRAHVRASSGSSVHSLTSPVIPILEGLLHRGPAFQVLTLSTVKDRHLFLFPNVLVIAKEVLPGASIPELNNSTHAESLFYPKSVLNLSTIQLKEDRPNNSVFENPQPHPIVASAIAEFTDDPLKAVSGLLEKRVLMGTPEHIAQFLHVTPGLSRRQLGLFLGMPQHFEIYSAFLDIFQFRGAKLIDALRIFLGVVRLPGDKDIIDDMLAIFARKWYSVNSNLVSYSEAVCIQLLFDTISLNAELHTAANFELLQQKLFQFQDSFFTRLPSDGLQYDLIESIQNSILKEKLAMVSDISAGAKSTPIYIEVEGSPNACFINRVTINAPSSLITIRIPQTDAHFRIVVSGRDLQVSPSAVLDFSTSSVARFRVRGTVLGKTFLMMSKMGNTAGKYVFMLKPNTVVPRPTEVGVDEITTPVWTRSIVVEKPFLRYTFQLEMRLANGGGVIAGSENAEHEDEETGQSKGKSGGKVKYMFSVPDGHSRRDWIKWFGRLGTDGVKSEEAIEDLGLASRIFKDLVEAGIQKKYSEENKLEEIDPGLIVPLTVDSIIEIVGLATAKKEDLKEVE